nr:hypothetical protein ABEDC_3285 [Acinetobacter lwoffii]
MAFWRKTYKYKLSTFSRAHGVVRKNRNDDHEDKIKKYRFLCKS